MPRRLPLTVAQILSWADWFHERAGRWPTTTSGRVPGARSESWVALNMALREGYRGLPGGDSLARLFARERGARNVGDLPHLKEDQVVAWAQTHHRRNGRWPHDKDGAVYGAPGEKWRNINQALRDGRRGFPGGDTLGKLLARKLKLRNRASIPNLTVKTILLWADGHHAKTGKWPHSGSGPVLDAPGEDWARVCEALWRGRRGLRGGTSLGRLLLRERNAYTRACPQRLTLTMVLRWADAHHARTGQWPTVMSGAIVGAHDETWSLVDQAMRHGRRGFPGGDSLHRLLCRRRGVTLSRARRGQTSKKTSA